MSEVRVHVTGGENIFVLKIIDERKFVYIVVDKFLIKKRDTFCLNNKMWFFEKLCFDKWQLWLFLVVLLLNS